jgi:hypothetical protein
VGMTVRKDIDSSEIFVFFNKEDRPALRRWLKKQTKQLRYEMQADRTYDRLLNGKQVRA